MELSRLSESVCDYICSQGRISKYLRKIQICRFYHLENLISKDSGNARKSLYIFVWNARDVHALWSYCVKNGCFMEITARTPETLLTVSEHCLSLKAAPEKENLF